MGLIFRKRIKILPGVNINLSKSGISTTVGRKGASMNIGKRGTYVNTGIPGSGIYLREKISSKRNSNNLNQYSMTQQTYGLPALISFFIPGLGQLIKGDIIKGIAIWIIGGVAAFFLWWTIVVPFVIWAWNVYDAYNSTPGR